MFLTEAAHSFGLCLFVFRVLPQYDVIRALLLMCSTNIVPSILKLILTKGDRGPLAVVMDILAVAMQASVFFLMTVFDRGQGQWGGPSGGVLPLVELAASLVLISVRYWENFVDRDLGAIPLMGFKQTMRLGRCKTYIFASLWKMALTLAFAYLLVPNMTPMAELFAHIGNETAYDNRTVRPGQDRLYPGPSEVVYPDPGSVEYSPSFSSSEGVDYPGEVPIAHDLVTEPIGVRVRREIEPPPEIPDATRTETPSTTPPTSPPPIATNPSDDYPPNERSPPRRPKPPSRVNHPSHPRLPDDTLPGYDYYSDLESEEDLTSELTDEEVDKVLYRLLPLIVQAASGAICYYFSRVACKLCMQRFSFSLPLTIITPGTVAIFCYLCHLGDWTELRLPNVEVGFWRCSESFQQRGFQWQIGCAVGLWWLSQLWINNHIWFPKSERLAKVER